MLITGPALGQLIHPAKGKGDPNGNATPVLVSRYAILVLKNFPLDQLIHLRLAG